MYMYIYVHVMLHMFFIKFHKSELSFTNKMISMLVSYFLKIQCYLKAFEKKNKKHFMCLYSGNRGFHLYYSS